MGKKEKRVCNLRRPQRKKGRYELPPGTFERQSVSLALTRRVRLK